MQLDTHTIDTQWQPLIRDALDQVDPNYLHELERSSNWLPGQQAIFNAFQLPLEKTRYILFGESPYPRIQSANGFAFWDADVHEIWSPTGLSKPVNRATSLRHIIKMLLCAENLLSFDDTSKSAIAAQDKTYLVHSLDELFQNFLSHGFLLLNASLVLHKDPVRRDAKAWLPFIDTLLTSLHLCNRPIELILFGKIAHAINTLSSAAHFPQLIAEHPYNISFIQNPKVIEFFGPLHLLRKHEQR